MSIKIIKIGRAADNDIVINEASISRYHCSISKDDNGNFVLCDFNSSNGTYLNGKKITHEIQLNAGDTVKIGLNTTLNWSAYFIETHVNEDDDAVFEEDDFDETDSIFFEEEEEEDVEDVEEVEDEDEERIEETSPSNGYGDKIIYAILFALLIGLASYFRNKY